MRILGIDYGTVRIGVALSDELLITASPYAVIKRKEPGAIKEPLRRIKEIAKEKDVSKIVLGLPRNLDGSDGDITEEVRAFGHRLQKETKLQVVFWDERLSSVQAERALVSADVSRKKRRESIDGVAASLILQGFLDYNCIIENSGKSLREINSKERNMEKDVEFDEMNDDETEEFDLIVLEDEETGEDVELVIVDSVELEDFSYLLVVPVQEFDDECPNATIIKELRDKDGEYVYEIVEEDEEFEEAAKLFEAEDEE